MVKKAALTMLFPVLLLLTGNLCAQNPADIFTRIESKTTGGGSVRISQDPNIRNMVNLHLSQQRKINGIKGFRICIFLDTGQEANKGADKKRAGFISRYENVKSYKKFEYPYYKVYVGDFRTKSEALRFLKSIEYDYPDAFIRDDLIAFPD